MLIDRRVRKFGQPASTIDLADAAVYWDGGIHFAKERIADGPDQDPANIHDYDVSFSLEEFRRVIDAVAKATLDVEKDTVAAGLAPSLKSLLQLVNCIVTAK